MSAPVVRRVAAADVPEVVALVSEILAEFGLTFGHGSETDAALTKLPESYDAGGGAFWVAERDGELIGTCGVYPVGPGTFELRKMYLRPAARGTGLGKRLLDESVAFVSGKKGRRIVLDTTEQMTRAIEFYEGHGFVRDDSVIRGARCSRGYVLSMTPTKSKS
jgi:GNAT superfamily N-acetyltransferase